MRSLLLTRVVLWALLAGGCAGEISEMPTWVAFDEDGNVEAGNDVAVVVLKVAPAASVLLAAGRIEPSGWRGRGPKSQVWLSAQDGFVVARVTPTRDETAYAVVEVRPDGLAGGQGRTAPTYETGFWSAVAGSPDGDRGKRGTAFRPLGEARVPCFPAVAGRVTFVGAIRIDPVAEADANLAPEKVGITPVTSPADSEAVARFLAERYPKVRARVVARPLQMMKRSEPTE